MPLDQEYKRRSGILQHQQRHLQHGNVADTGTSPPAEPLLGQSLSLGASSGSLSSSVSLSDRSASTDCVEEYIGDVPFAGK